MITANESQSIFDIGKYYVVLPNDDLIQSKSRKKYLKFKFSKLLGFIFFWGKINFNSSPFFKTKSFHVNYSIEIIQRRKQ